MIITELARPLPHVIGEIIEDRLEPLSVQPSVQLVPISVQLSGAGISAAQVQELINQDNAQHDDVEFEPVRLPISNLPPLP